MMDFLLRAGAGILGIATFLLAWGWLPICIFWLPDHLIYRWRMSGARAASVARFAALIGSGLLWLAFSYLLPDWWVGATPVIVSE